MMIKGTPPKCIDESALYQGLEILQALIELLIRLYEIFRAFFLHPDWNRGAQVGLGNLDLDGQARQVHSLAGSINMEIPSRNHDTGRSFTALACAGNPSNSASVCTAALMAG